jgi:hypothetical protein
MTSAILAVYFSLMGAVLTIYVITRRAKFKVLSGDGGNPEMNQAIRAHANFCEQTPLALVLFVIAELIAVSPIALYILAVLLVVGRTVAAWGLSRSLGLTQQRKIGAALTILFNVGIALAILFRLLLS